MSTKKILAIIGVCVTGLAVIFLMIRFIYGGPEDLWFCDGNEWVKHGNPRDPKPERPCGTIQKNTEKTTGIANPASVYCLDSGGFLAFRADAQGNTYAVCSFNDGRECEEWEFFRTKQCGGVPAETSPDQGIMETMPTY